MHFFCWLSGDARVLLQVLFGSVGPLNTSNALTVKENEGNDSVPCFISGRPFPCDPQTEKIVKRSKLPVESE